MKKLVILSVVLAGLLAFWSCQKDLPTTNTHSDVPSLPAESYKYGDLAQALPFHMQAAYEIVGSAKAEHRVDNIDDDIATLGRVLFYDTRLSLNNKVACASCHKQQNAFADGNALSPGFKGMQTTRNSMALANPALNNSLFWDSRTANLQELALEPVKNHIEMGMEEMEHLTVKLEQTDFYPELFKKAYNSEAITPNRVANALAHFLMSMVSYNSKFDQGLYSDFSNFNALELEGKTLFFSEKTQCASCHSGVNFSAPDISLRNNFNHFNDNPNVASSVAHLFEDPQMEEVGFLFKSLSPDPDPEEPINPYSNREISGTANIGLDVNYADNGRGNGRFRIPTLRNIELTGPYMHDGRFNTLEEVVDHYAGDIQPHRHLDSKFKTSDGNVAPVDLTAHEKQALTAFLRTLTDKEFVTDEKFSNPFIQ